MTLDVYMGSRFVRSHENEAFYNLKQIITKEMDDQYSILIGNFSCAGCELDALLIKRDAIIIIDFKNYGGRIRFSENGYWKNEKTVIMGGVSINPYQQIRRYKSGLIDWLQTHKILLSNENVTHISGLVLFQGKIIFQKDAMPKNLSYWFGVCDFSSVGSWISHRASPKLNLSKERMERIVSELGVQSELVKSRSENEIETFQSAGSKILDKPLRKNSEALLVNSARNLITDAFIVVSLLVISYLAIMGLQEKGALNSSNDLKYSHLDAVPLTPPKSQEKKFLNGIANGSGNSHSFPKATTINARMYIGRTIVLCGVVHSVSKQRKATYINFDHAYPNQSLSAVVWNDAMFQSYIKAGEEVCVYGDVSEYKGSPQIKITQRSQIFRDF